MYYFTLGCIWLCDAIGINHSLKLAVAFRKLIPLMAVGLLQGGYTLGRGMETMRPLRLCLMYTFERFLSAG